MGQVANILFRVPPLYIDLEYESGRVLTYRFLPSTASNGMLMNPLPTNLGELAGLFKGDSYDKLKAFRITSGRIAYYDDNIAIRWEEAAD
jgi:hypothetical protein